MHISSSDEQLGTTAAGTGPEVFGNTNAPPAVTYSAIIYSLRCMVPQEIPLNQGCLAPITVRIPPQCLLSPSKEAAVVGGNVLTSQRVTDVVLKCFKAAAASQVGHVCSTLNHHWSPPFVRVAVVLTIMSSIFNHPARSSMHAAYKVVLSCSMLSLLPWNAQPDQLCTPVRIQSHVPLAMLPTHAQMPSDCGLPYMQSMLSCWQEQLCFQALASQQGFDAEPCQNAYPECRAGLHEQLHLWR